MSVKKLLVLSAAGLASVAAVAAFAGGPDVAPAPAPVPAPSYQGLYIQGDVGYAYVPFGNTYGLGLKNNFFTVGGDLGYQFTQHLAAEAGGFWHNNTSVRGPFGSNLKITDWYLFLAGKLMAPLPWVDNVKVFGKAGVAFRRVGENLQFLGFSFGSTNHWFVRPLFGLGLQYNINDAWFTKVQWVYVDGVNRFSVPAINQFTLGLGYKFSI